MSLGTTLEESQAKRKEHLLDALYHRRKGNKKAVKACRNCASFEKLKQRYFLGDLPF